MSPSVPLDPWLGRLIGDRQRYCLKQHIGGGGMGDVYLATDMLLGRPVALKLLNSRLATVDLKRRFEQEVAVCAALKNDHIVQVTDYGVTHEGYPFYVMEYLRGQTLGELLHQERRLSIQRTVTIIHQICSGLYPAHQGINLWRDGAGSSEYIKVIHRDLKPDNIFLISTALGEFVKILDFGIAKIWSSQSNYTNLTNAFLGTYRYAAPEQLENEKNLDERADIYSLGMLLYEMLTGTHPFSLDEQQANQELTGVGWAVAHLTRSLVPLRSQPGCEELPPELEAVVLRCLEKTPDRRFSSVVELSQALHAAVPNAGNLQLTISENFAATIGAPLAATTMLKNLRSAETHSSRAIPTALANTVIHKPSRSFEPSIFPLGLLRNPARSLLGVGVLGIAALAFMMYWLRLPDLIVRDRAQPIIQPSPSSTQLATRDSQPAAPLPTMAVDSFSGHTDTVWTVAVSPDQRTVVSGGYDRTIRIWNFQGELLRTLYGHGDAVRSIAFSANGKLLASGSSDKTIKIWDFQSGKLLRTLTGHSGPVWSVAISSNGQTLASGSYDGTIRIWNMQTGQQIRTLPEHYDSIWSIAISPDGQTLSSASYDGTVKIWNLQSGGLRRTLVGHADAVRSIAISRDGQTLASSSWDKTIKLWNLQTGELLKTLVGHSDRVLAIAISPDSRTLASGSSDRTIRLWDISTGTLQRTFSGHSDWVVSVAFAAQQNSMGVNRHTLVSGSKDKTVKLWQW